MTCSLTFVRRRSSRGGRRSPGDVPSWTQDHYRLVITTSTVRTAASFIFAMLLAATPSQFNDAPIRPIFTLETLETKKLQHTNQDRIKAFFEAGDLLPTYPAPHVVRRLNASIPFAVLGSDRPRPLAMDVQSPEFAKALDCMASALFYEAGESRTDQAAVAQVVMNRLRHPAFPHSICAVVYQGAERETGCQFTFTCDGSLRRAPSSAAWQAARATAKAFLRARPESC